MNPFATLLSFKERRDVFVVRSDTPNRILACLQQQDVGLIFITHVPTDGVFLFGPILFVGDSDPLGYFLVFKNDMVYTV